MGEQTALAVAGIGRKFYLNWAYWIIRVGLLWSWSHEEARNGPSALVAGGERRIGDALGFGYWVVAWSRSSKRDMTKHSSVPASAYDNALLL